MRALAATLVVSLGLCGTLVACGGDDQYVQPGGNTGDGGKTDGGLTDGGKTDGGPGTDGGDGGTCAFTAFVIDQVTNHTADNSVPVTNANIPDPTCSLTGTTGDYSALFTK